MLFDDLLQEIGEGIFQRFAIAVTGIAVLAESLATTSVPFVAALASCDLNLSLGQVLGLNAVVVIGMLLGGFWLGAVADVSGRKYILSTTSIITFISCFVASFAQCIIMLFVSLFFLGVGLGGNHTTTRVYIIEIIPKSCRGSRYITLEIFSAIGYILAIGIFRLLVPPTPDLLKAHFVRFNSWRILFGLSGSLSIFSACLMSVFPASPRWLLAKRQEPETLEILRKLYAINKVKHEESFPNVHLDPILYINIPADDLYLQCNGHFWRTVRSVKTYTLYLFKEKYLKPMLVGALISGFFFDGLVMLNIWLALSNLNSKCEIQGASPAVISNPDDYCSFQSLDDLFKLNFYYSFSSLLLVALMLIIDKIPRKYALLASAILAGGCSITFALAPYEDLKMSMAFFTLAFCFAAESTLRLILLESFPTILRGTAYGLAKSFSRSTLVLLIILQSSCVWSYVVFGIFFIMAGCLSVILPSLSRQPLED